MPQTCTAVDLCWSNYSKIPARFLLSFWTSYPLQCLHWITKAWLYSLYYIIIPQPLVESIIMPACAARGKAISLSICCYFCSHYCQHKNGQISMSIDIWATHKNNESVETFEKFASYYASNCLVTSTSIYKNTVFLAMPINCAPGHVFSAHVHNLPLYHNNYNEDCQQTHAHCCRVQIEALQDADAVQCGVCTL